MPDQDGPSREYVTLPLGSLTEREGNARKHPTAQIAAVVKSMNEFGFTKLIVVDENNVILAGHARVRAASRRGDRTIPCVRVRGWDEKNKAAFAIADNRVAELSEWDTDALELELKRLPDLEEEFAALIREKTPTEPEAKKAAAKDKSDAVIVQFCKVKIEATPDEAERLLRLLRAYSRMKSLKTGFWRWLLSGGATQKAAKKGAKDA